MEDSNKKFEILTFKIFGQRLLTFGQQFSKNMHSLNVEYLLVVLKIKNVGKYF